jgi:multiple sugar transport system permease protein
MTATSTTTARPARAASPPPTRRPRGAGRQALPWLVPATVLVGALTIAPTLHGLWLGFTATTVSGASSDAGFLGLDNHLRMLADPVFLNALRVTAVFTFGALAAQLVLGVGLALLLHRDLPGRNVARTALIATMVLSPVVVGTVWRLLLSNQGPVNDVLRLLGLPEQNWLADPSAVLPALIAVDVWQWTPLVMLIVLAGLQGISPELYEASQLDGASAWQSFRAITLPLLAPSIAIAALIRLIDAARAFDLIYAMTGGGPGDASENLNVMAFYAGFQSYEIGYASAIATVVLVFIVVACALLVRLFGVRLWGVR